MVRAKFKVIKVERQVGSFYDQATKTSTEKEVQTVVLSPVYSTDPEHENKKFWDATPTGEIRLGVVNPEAWKSFELGREYYVDFTLAAAGPAA